MSLSGLITEHIRTEGARRTAQHYLAYSGDYSNYSLIEDFGLSDVFCRHVPGREDHVPYEVSVEHFLIDRVGELLRAKNEPVVVMDIGAAAALSLMRLAQRYQQAIEHGDLAVVATNAGLKVADYIKKLSGAERAEARDLHAHIGASLHEISTTFRPGQQYEVALPTGSVLNLAHQVSIAHERLSLTAWGDDLGAQVPEVGRLISPQGVYMVPIADTVYKQPDRCRRTGAAGAALDAAHRALQEHEGMWRTMYAEEGPNAGRLLNYVVFEGAEAAPVRI
jgi:hypothetical protein